MLTARQVDALLRYEPKTGHLYWRTSGPGRRLGQPAGWISNGYRVIRINDQTYLAHRLIFLLAHGAWPKHHIDHKNQNRSDNRLDNLRVTDHARNRMNTGPNKNTISGLRGVVFYKRAVAKPWGATIKIAGRQTYLGVYATREEAARAYDQKAREVFGEHAYLNFR